MEVFLSYRQYSGDFTSIAGGDLNVGGSLEDFSVVMGGARIKF